MLVGVHCEDRPILTAAAGNNGTVRTYADLVTARPEEAEAVSVASLIELTRGSGARTHVLHLSTARSAELVRRAQSDGVTISAETCPHYLTLTADDFASAGAALKVFPPVRDRQNREALWDAMTNGVIGSVGSDHAPHSPADRSGDFAKQPAGTTAVETMVRVMIDQSAQGRMSLEHVAWVMAENTARLYGLYPRKGSLEVGADGDLTLVDLAQTWTIRNERLHSKHPMSPWNGVSGKGAPVMTLLRGKVIMRDGEPVGAPQGRLVRPAISRRLHSQSSAVGG